MFRNNAAAAPSSSRLSINDNQLNAIHTQLAELAKQAKLAEDKHEALQVKFTKLEFNHKALCKEHAALREEHDALQKEGTNLQTVVSYTSKHCLEEENAMKQAHAKLTTDFVNLSQLYAKLERDLAKAKVCVKTPLMENKQELQLLTEKLKPLKRVKMENAPILAEPFEALVQAIADTHHENQLPTLPPPPPLRPFPSFKLKDKVQLKKDHGTKVDDENVVIKEISTESDEYLVFAPVSGKSDWVEDSMIMCAGWHTSGGKRTRSQSHVAKGKPL